MHIKPQKKKRVVVSNFYLFKALNARRLNLKLKFTQIGRWEIAKKQRKYASAHLSEA